MTGALNLDALRELSTWLYDESRNDKSQVAAAAADELDSLQDDLANVRKDRDFMLQTITRLRSLLDAAPHAYECFADFAPGAKCTCWKADAL